MSKKDLIRKIRSQVRVALDMRAKGKAHTDPAMREWLQGLSKGMLLATQYIGRELRWL